MWRSRNKRKLNRTELISECEVQTVYTDKPEPDSLSQDNPEICYAPLTQVSEIQQDQSVIPSVTAYHS